MSTLFEIGYHGELLAIDQITRIAPEVKSGTIKTRTVLMRDGWSKDVHPNEADELLARPVQLIPAAPRTFVVRVWFENGEGDLGKTSVVAWALCMDGEMRPVTPQGVNDGQSRHAHTYVLMPDGTVQSVGEYTEPVYFDNADEYVLHMVAEKLAERPA